MQQAEHVVLGKALAAFQEVELHRECKTRDLAAQLPHQTQGGFHRAAGSQKVVDQQHALSGGDGIFMDFKRV